MLCLSSRIVLHFHHYLRSKVRRLLPEECPANTLYTCHRINQLYWQPQWQLDCHTLSKRVLQRYSLVQSMLNFLLTDMCDIFSEIMFSSPQYEECLYEFRNRFKFDIVVLLPYFRISGQVARWQLVVQRPWVLYPIVSMVFLSVFASQELKHISKVLTDMLIYPQIFSRNEIE